LRRARGTRAKLYPRRVKKMHREYSSSKKGFELRDLLAGRRKYWSLHLVPMILRSRSGRDLTNAGIGALVSMTIKRKEQSAFTESGRGFDCFTIEGRFTSRGKIIVFQSIKARSDKGATTEQESPDIMSRNCKDRDPTRVTNKRGDNFNLEAVHDKQKAKRQ